MSSEDIDGEAVDAPDAPSYEDPPDEAQDLKFDVGGWTTWPLWARLRLLRRLRTDGSSRPEQYIDASLLWYLWLLLGGRGSGKSDEASRWSAEDGLRLPRLRFALIGRTFADVRDTMFEGETGLLAIIPDYALRGGRRQRAYNRSLGELYLANGTKFKGFSAEKAAALRGPQHHRAWADEASSWEDADVSNILSASGTLAPAADTTMSNLMLGLRLTAVDGSSVRMVVSTTPKPNELTELLEATAKTKGQLRVLTTYSNLDNLDAQVRDVVLGMYEGTDVAAQELEGKILRQAKGAAWDIAAVEAAGSRESFGEQSRVVLGIDPAVSSKETSDETGLVVVALEVELRPDDATNSWQPDKGIHVVADLSGKMDVARFGSEVVSAVEIHMVDVVVVEINNGYDFVVNAITSHVEAEGGIVVRRMRKETKSVKTRSRVVVEYVCETADGHAFVLKPVWQSIDKLTRAKAASVWWHQGKARHAQGLELLEKQMTTYDGSGKKSPDRLDALSSAVAEFSGDRKMRPARGASPLNLDGANVGAVTHPLLAAPSAGVDSPWAQTIH